MFKKILVPTDASENSRRALKMALELASSYQAEVLLLHVSYTPQAYWGYTISYGITVTQEQLDQNGELALDVTLSGVDQGQIVINKRVEAGHPVTVILDQIKQESIDLVVMGSHGYGAITGSVLGSVSQRVLQRASCPVLIIK
ncbi:universal stress protein [Desulfosporosinus sp. BICA1-9]|uniref:universal stress protein n=1 Tax=Desulfosporosinus sp. BICA1-9 TaxID=1531958 RepID=UPI00054BB6FC|nr:universal stress protein [Desulfosporosinus sp. BICA1-9]KJS50717.1 MAG: universal stress protein UspA [Peptococcaceae bacterium BRH_c23]KJS82401.1 MAG: universal stress protein UspA [Desulfosporosinus sp. BICA1-9]HBW38850.1 universal stress protein [Desulfosporosinus sp.]